MRKAVSLAILLAVLSLFASAQSDDAKASPSPAAETPWTRYKVSSEKISIEFPTLPVRQDSEDICSQIKRTALYAFRNDVVYELVTVSKLKKSVPVFVCPGRRTGFDERRITDRVDELRESNPTSISAQKISAREATAFTWDLASHLRARLMIVNPDKKGWVEVAVYSRKNSTMVDDRFLDSLRFTPDGDQEVGDGAPSIVGDVYAGKSDPVADGLQTDDALVIIANPRATYTESARRSNVQGSILLKVTLLANGSIGAVTVVRGLEGGLTEKAVAAAHKIVFLPKRVKGDPVTSVKTMEYTFSIY